MSPAAGTDAAGRPPAAPDGATASAGDPDRPVRVDPPFTVFLDRDGVFNEHPRVAVRRWEDFHWLPGVKQAFARLNRPGIQTSLATNQPTVGMGLTLPSRIHAIHTRMVAGLETAGGRLDHVEAAFAPPGFPSRRRKPAPGMLEAGAAAFAARGTPVEKDRAVMVGDQVRDAGAAGRFGIPAILVATRRPAQVLQSEADAARVPVLAVVPDLAAAVDMILRRIARLDGGVPPPAWDEDD